MLKATSTAHHILVRKHIYRRSRLLVRPFVSIPDNLFLIMKLSNSVISGSSALQFMLPFTSQNWTCHDLDIYTPITHGLLMTNFLKLEGYRVLRTSKAQSSYRPGNFDVTTMKKGNLSIDIVVVHGASFFTVISRFHLTCVMNFLSADGFFSAYPTLTASGYSIVSHLSFAEHGALTPRRPTVRSYRKYRERGFKLLHLPPSVPLSRCDNRAPNHVCGRSAWCPHTLRTTNDPYCLYVPFEAHPTSVTPEKAPKPVLYHARFATVWMLGGTSCDGMFKPLRPFSTIRGYDSD